MYLTYRHTALCMTTNELFNSFRRNCCCSTRKTQKSPVICKLLAETYVNVKLCGTNRDCRQIREGQMKKELGNKLKYETERHHIVGTEHSRTSKWQRRKVTALSFSCH